jgi:hypothetical protein
VSGALIVFIEGVDKAQEESAAAVVALGFELGDEVATAARERLMRGDGLQECLVCRQLVVEEEELDFGPRAEGAAFVAVDVERFASAEDADHEAPWQADRFGWEAEATGDE